MHPTRHFPSSLGTRERLITYLVGYGVGIGVPLLLGVTFAAAFRQWAPLLLPVPFALMLGVVYLFRPTGLSVTPRAIAIRRPMGPRNVALEKVQAVVTPAPQPVGFTIRLIGVDGLYGTFGTFWNRKWSRFQMFVTDHEKRVALLLADGSRIIVSPDDPLAFGSAVKEAAAQAGLPLLVTVAE